YFHPICEYLHRHGYKDHETLFGAPYDFRLILDPPTRNSYFQSLKELIERAANKRQKGAVFVTHSLGGVVLKWFFSEYVGQEWVDKYVHRWICVSSPFGGSYQALRSVTCGDHYVPTLREHIQEELKYVTGIVMCMPNQLAFHANEPLLHIEGGKDITIEEYQQLAEEHALAFQLWKDLYEPNHKYIEAALKVPTELVVAKHLTTYGVGFARSLDSVPHRVSTVHGDGIVPSKSLLAIEKVLDRRHIHEHVFGNYDHTSILGSSELIRLIHWHAMVT
ncbi:MAG: hypothetical protein EBS08_07100, partial [Cytophagia bacterium]|nr:hypothetical protein [Cytophagia bacterium]